MTKLQHAQRLTPPPVGRRRPPFCLPATVLLLGLLMLLGGPPASAQQAPATLTPELVLDVPAAAGLAAPYFRA